jgi:hypothetical protein
MNGEWCTHAQSNTAEPLTSTATAAFVCGWNNSNNIISAPPQFRAKTTSAYIKPQAVLGPCRYCNSRRTKSTHSLHSPLFFISWSPVPPTIKPPTAPINPSIDLGDRNLPSAQHQRHCFKTSTCRTLPIHHKKFNLWPPASTH